jgi:hypothetical protein
MIKFNITNNKVRIFDNSDIGVVVWQENIESPVKIGVIATNIFEKYNNRWLLIHQQRSVSNYMPPNLCSIKYMVPFTSKAQIPLGP